MASTHEQNGTAHHSAGDESDGFERFHAHFSAFNVCVALGWGCQSESPDTPRLLLVNDPAIRTEDYADAMDHALLGMLLHCFDSPCGVISSGAYIGLLDAIGWRPIMIGIDENSSERTVRFRRGGLRERVEVSYGPSEGGGTFQLSELEDHDEGDAPNESPVTVQVTSPGQLSYTMKLGTARYLEKEMTYALDTLTDSEIIVGRGRIAETTLCRVMWAMWAYVNDGGSLWVRKSDETYDAPQPGRITLGDGSNGTTDVHRFLREHEEALRSSGVVERFRRKWSG